jgi:murein DD-endopeptidase MepM/ murein hydrolase activator NlpD
MKSLLGRRPSPALMIALIALFVSLSGVSYGVASGFIDSREIKNNEVRSLDIRNNEIRTRDLRNNEVRGIDIRNSTIQSRDIAINAVRGEDVREDTLQKVPSALLADNANTANSANSADAVGGVRVQRIAYQGAEGSAKQTIVNLGGLTITAECQMGPTLELVANPAAHQPHSHLAWGDWTDAGAGNKIDFNPGENATIVFAGEAIRSGTVSFAGSDGSIVTIAGLAVEHANGIRNTTDDCGVFAVASVG